MQVLEIHPESAPSSKKCLEEGICSPKCLGKSHASKFALKTNLFLHSEGGGLFCRKPTSGGSHPFSANPFGLPFRLALTVFTLWKMLPLCEKIQTNCVGSISCFPVLQTSRLLPILFDASTSLALSDIGLPVRHWC